MNARIVAALVVLVVVAVSPSSATSLTGTKSTVGNLTTYTYNVTSTELGDYVTAVHVYAPLSVSLISAHTAPAHSR